MFKRLFKRRPKIKKARFVIDIEYDARRAKRSGPMSEWISFEEFPGMVTRFTTFDDYKGPTDDH